MHCQLLDFHNFKNLGARLIAGLVALGWLSVFGCSHTEKILMPPPMDLTTYKAIGVITFSTNAETSLGEHVTQDFMRTVQSSQPGVRFLELGDKAQVLETTGRKQLDLEAVKSIGSAYHVDALLFGKFKISEPKLNFHMSTTWQSIHAGAHLEALLMTKIWETDSGVTLWTNSTSGKKPVASMKADTNGNIKFGVSDPKDKYGRLVAKLVYVNTADLRPYWIRRKVK